METIISLLLFGAIYSIVYVAKSLSGKPGGNGREPFFGEEFPTIEILEPEQEQPFAEPEPILQPVAKSLPEPPKQRRKPVDRSPQTSAPSATKTIGVEKKKRLVELNSKSDAKRAFIYSEIFNRKY